MNSKKSSGSRKDPLKTPKVWERARREKMKIYFNELQEVLPFYDPSAPMSRFEILQKSKTYIKDLQDQNQELLNGGFDEVYKVKMTKLKQRVKELLKRVDQLTDILRTANIMIPPLETYPEGPKSINTFKWMSQHPKKWSEKINLVIPDDKIKNILTLIKDYKKSSNKKVKLKKKQLSKTSEKSEITLTSEPHLQRTVLKKKRVLKKTSKVINLKSSKPEKSDFFSESQSPTQFKENQPVDFNLISNVTVSSKKTNTLECNNSVPVEVVKSDAENSGCEISKSSTSISKITLPQNVIVPSVPNVLQPNTFILTNDGSLVQLPILNSSGSMLHTSSNLLTPTAVVKPSGELLTPLVINKPSPVIVLQKPSTRFFQTAQIINATPQIIVSKPVHILDTTNVYTGSSAITAAKSLPHLLSKTPSNKKRIARDSTVTTYVNKIPIPALSKQLYAKRSSPSNQSKKDLGNKIKVLEKPKENKNEKENEKENTEESDPQQNKEITLVNNESEEKTTEVDSGLSNKEKIIPENKVDIHKKQKLNENLLNNPEDNVFRPIENDTNEVFCNLALPNTINPSLSVSPTAAFLSSFPIVAPTRSETEDETPEKKSDEGKDSKSTDPQPCVDKNKEIIDTTKEQSTSNVVSKETPRTVQQQTETTKDNMTSNEQIKLVPGNNFTTNTVVTNRDKTNIGHQQLPECKSWEQFHDEGSETFYMGSSENADPRTTTVETVNLPSVSYSNPSYKNYTQSGNIKTNNLNEGVSLESNNFEYLQKENYISSKASTYNTERSLPGKRCNNTGNISDTYSLAKNQANYQMDTTPSYQLIPAKEVSSQRNSRTVNWMTEPDITNRPPVYSSQVDKMSAGKNSTFDSFYVNQPGKILNEFPGQFVNSDQNKTNFQKNEFYGKDQRCKNMEKRTETKCYTKTPQNSYNIFDYNYSPSCYGDESSSKYCQNSGYTGKMKKTLNQPKKKPDVQTSEISKRPPDHVDFANQECFTWVPGKNVEWLTSKSFGLDSNLVVPSTLPTLVGDLALGTTSTTEISQKNPKTCGPSIKSNLNDVNKDYVDINMGLPKPVESDMNKQYFEPFANLSKNIFDVTNTNNAQIPKNDYDKINFVGNNTNETIVLKNIFELPVSKAPNSEFNRNKQRAINHSQNTFLSVSQLVEPSGFEGSSIKTNQDVATKVDPYAQNYPNYNQKNYKNKTRSSHCKFNERKYHAYKNGSSSSYTAEALIRSNSNGNFQTNEFLNDNNTNFFTSKTNQKPDQFSSNGKTDFEINMAASSGQNIYSDFNFSSPVPNFSLGTAVGTDFGNHDNTGNLATQNNSFFGDFITPEFPLTDNVSNSLLLPQCSIPLQNPYVTEKRNEKNKNSKQCQAGKSRKHYECSKTSFNDFSLPPTTAIFTSSNISCPTIFTTSACQNLLPVPSQNIPISFSSPSFTTSNIGFPSLSSGTTSNYHRFPNSPNSSSGGFLSSNAMFTTCTSKPLSSSHNCYSSNPLTSVTNSVISSFSVGNVSLSTSSQSTIPFFSLSNPIIPSTVPSSSSNSLANFNLSTIFPEINQKGNYHYS